MMEYGRICRKKYLTYVCGSDWNIHPEGTRPFRSEPQHMIDTINLNLSQVTLNRGKSKMCLLNMNF
jgi:hypothetical protein